jgi:hypothetical protein
MQSDVQTPALLRGGRIRQRSQGPAGRLSKRQAAAVRGDNIPPPHGRRHSLSSVHRCPPSQAPPRPTVHQRSRGQTNSNWSNCCIINGRGARSCQLYYWNAADGFPHDNFTAEIEGCSYHSRSGDALHQWHTWTKMAAMVQEASP